MDNYQIDKYIQDGQDPKVVEKIHSKILDMLTPGESINYIALQKKPAVTLLPDSITVSNKRIFLCEFTKLGLATNFEIFPWSDIKDIAFKEEIFGSKVTVIPFTGENLTIDYIPKTQARKLYQLIKAALDNLQQEKAEVKKSKIVIENKPVFPPSSNSPSTYEEEKQEEKPVEDKPRAWNYPEEEHPKEQGDKTTPIATPAYSSASNYSDSQNNHSNNEEEDEMTSKLKKLKGLYDKQLITQAEYETKKAEILSKL